MPRTRSLAWAELKIGVVSLIAVVLALAMAIGAPEKANRAWYAVSAAGLSSTT